MSHIHHSAQAHSATFTKKQRSIALAVVALAFVMDLLDNTIVNVAIPTIQANLGASYSAIQWLLAGYSLTFALLLITGGRMGDVFGYKKVFMFGVAGFTVASLLCGVAGSPLMLVGARLIQGAMAALMVPQVMSLMQVMYKPEERGAINGLFGALGGLAASLGPIIGGLLIKANVGGWDWRPIFLINVPVGVFAFFMARRYLPNGKSEHPLHLDLVGTMLVLVAMTLLIFPLIEGRELDWPAWTYSMLAASVPAFGLFAKWQHVKMKRDGSPLVAPTLFRKRSFTAGLLINMIFEAAMLGFFLTFTLVIQVGLGFSPIHAALTGLPVAVGIALTMATMGDKIAPKLGRRAIVIGVCIMAAGLVITNAILRHYGLTTHSWQLIPGQLLIGVGMGFVFTSLFAAVLSGVDVKHAGSASGMLNAVQQVGGAIGVALIGVVFFGQVNQAAATSFDTVAPKLQSQLSSLHIPADVQRAIVGGVKQCYVDRTREKDNTVVPESCRVLEHGGEANAQVGKVVAAAAAKANDENFNRAFTHGVIFEISLIGVVLALSFMLPKHFNAEAYQEI